MSGEGPIDPRHSRIGVFRQCELLGLGRSSYYYEPVPIDVEDLRLQRLIDEKYTELPIYGVRRMTEWLRRDMHENVEDKRVRRMMHV